MQNSASVQPRTSPSKFGGDSVLCVIRRLKREGWMDRVKFLICCHQKGTKLGDIHTRMTHALSRFFHQFSFVSIDVAVLHSALLQGRAGQQRGRRSSSRCAFFTAQAFILVVNRSPRLWNCSCLPSSYMCVRLQYSQSEKNSKVNMK